MKASDIVNGKITDSFTLGMLLMNSKMCPQSQKFYVYVSYRKQKKVLDRPISSKEKTTFHKDLKSKTGLKFARTAKEKKALNIPTKPRCQFIACIDNDISISEEDLQEKIITQIENTAANLHTRDFLSGAFSLRGTLDKKRSNTSRSFQGKCKVLCDFIYCTTNHKNRKFNIIKSMINGNHTTMDINNGAARQPRTAQFRIYALIFRKFSYLSLQYKQDCLDEVCK